MEKLIILSLLLWLGLSLHPFRTHEMYTKQAKVEGYPMYDMCCFKNKGESCGAIFK